MLNRRADEHYRNQRKNHIPTCTCVDCERKRKGLPPISALPTAPTESDWEAFPEIISETPEDRAIRESEAAERKIAEFLSENPSSTQQEIIDGTSLSPRVINLWLDKAGAVKEYDATSLRWRYSLKTPKPRATFDNPVRQTPKPGEASGNPIRRIFKTLWPF